MRSTRHRLGFLLIVAAVAVPLAAVSFAYACGVLTTLHLAPKTVRQGADVTGFGRNYSSSPAASAVTLHLNSRKGQVLWSGRASSTGLITPSFSAPNVHSGYYTVLAEQTGTGNRPSPGTPGRATIYVGTRKSRSHASRSGAFAAIPPSAGGRSGGGYAFAGLDAVALTSLLSAGLLGSGLLVRRAGRRGRRSTAPAA